MREIRSIGIIGYGKFGKVLADVLPQVFPHAKIRIHSRSRESVEGRFNTLEEAALSDLVIPAVPIHVFEDVINSVAPLLSEESIVMDVCSIKEYPVQIMRRHLPEYVGIIASHPMFGPGTLAKIKGQLTDLKIVMHNVQASEEDYTMIKEKVSKAGLEVVEVSPEEHDKSAAEFHFTAHYLSSILKKAKLSRSAIDTKSAESLFDYLEMIQADSPRLLLDMYVYNRFCKSQLDKLLNEQKHITQLLQAAR